MSGSLPFNIAPSWITQLRQASFRGVQFYFEETTGAGGRRLVTHKFPYRDAPYTEDIGQEAQTYRMRCYVIGAGYMTQREKLLAAVQNYATPAVLVHPTRGNRNCNAGLVKYIEKKDLGGYCQFDLEFTETGQLPSPTSTQSTASTVLAGIVSALPIIEGAYGLVAAAIANPAVLLAVASDGLGSLASQLTGLPVTSLTGLTGFATQLIASASSTSPSTTASSVDSTFQSIAANVIASQPVPAGTDDPVAGTVPNLLPSADPTGGLAPFASFSMPQVAALSSYYNNTTGYTGPAVSPSGISPAAAPLATLQQAFVDLVAGSATVAIATIYANTDFTTSNAADAALSQMQTMFDNRVSAAAYASSDALFLAWRALESQVLLDLMQRAQSLPTIAPYAIGFSLPSLTLAQLFYQDSTQGDALDELNNVPHPLFMPVTGLRLSAAS